MDDGKSNWDKLFKTDEPVDIIAELERENAMMRARNERLEKELAWLETAVNNANTALLNMRSTTEWVGLTEEEAAACWHAQSYVTWRNIEAKLKEKNHGKA